MRKSGIVCIILAFVMLFSACGETEEAAEKSIWDEGGTKPYDYTLDEYVALGKYNGLDDAEVKLTYDAAARTIAQALVKYQSDVKISESELTQSGSLVTLNCKSSLNGNDCDFLNANDISVVIDGASTVSSISDKYVSRLAGKALENAVMSMSKTAELIIPDYYESEFAGKSITLSVEVTKIEKVDLSEVSEDKKQAIISGFSEDDEKLESYAKKRILWKKVIDDTSFYSSLPASEVERCKTEYTDYYKELAKGCNLTYSEYLKSCGLNEKKVIADAEEYAKSRVERELTAFAICKEENILPGKNECEKLAYEIAVDLGYEGYDDFLTYNSETSIYIYVVWEKAAEFIASHTKNSEIVEN